MPNLKEELPKAFTPQGSGVVVGNEKFIFLRNHEFFSIFRKANDAMAIYKMNQGEITRVPSRTLLDEFSSGYIVSIGINQKPEALVSPTCRIGDYLKNCGF